LERLLGGKIAARVVPPFFQKLQLFFANAVE
jgi:hypothetical protein